MENQNEFHLRENSKKKVSEKSSAASWLNKEERAEGEFSIKYLHKSLSQTENFQIHFS